MLLWLPPGHIFLHCSWIKLFVFVVFGSAHFLVGGCKKQSVLWASQPIPRVAMCFPQFGLFFEKRMQVSTEHMSGPQPPQKRFLCCSSILGCKSRPACLANFVGTFGWTQKNTGDSRSFQHLENKAPYQLVQDFESSV